MTTRDLAEPLASFDDTQAVETVRAFLEKEDFDVIGVRRGGSIAGYADRAALFRGTLGDHVVEFEEAVLLSEVAPIVEVLRRLVEAPRVFVASRDHIWGIITWGDLQKAPMRMCLFGLISLLEMQLPRMIRNAHPGSASRSAQCRTSNG